jgi:hypothetical protein
MATVNDVLAWAKELVDAGHGDLDVMVGFDDVPDYINDLYLGGVATVKGEEPGDEDQPVVTTWYSNTGAYELVEKEDE